MNRRMRLSLTKLFVAFPFLGLLLLGGCSSPRSETTTSATRAVDRALALYRRNPAANAALTHAYAYAIFPSIIKGALGLGVARGMGQVYRGGQLVGVASLTQASLGFQLGGESFSELIVFMSPKSFHKFTDGTFSFGASATAVVIRAGVHGSAGYGAGQFQAGGEANGPKNSGQGFAASSQGYSVYVIVRGGLLASLAIGGQHFGYHPL